MIGLPGSKELKKLYIKDGLSLVELGKRFKCSPSTIASRLRKYNISVRKAGQKRALPDIEVLKHLRLKEFKTYAEIAQIYHVSRQAVGELLNSYGLHGHLDKLPSIEVLQDLNHNKRFSIADIAIKHNTSSYIVKRKFKEGRVSILDTRSNYLDFSLDLKEFLDGLLLGDGCLRILSSCSANYLHSDKNYSYIAWLSASLTRLGIDVTNRIGTTVQKSKYSGESYTAHKLYSLSYRGDFFKYAQSWYGKHKPYRKRVPEDIELTPVILFNWYIGDGSFSNGYNVYLCRKYNKRDSHILNTKLHQIGINSTITNPKYSQGMRIMADSRDYFFEYILSSGLEVLECYHHKFPDKFHYLFK